MFCSNCGTPYEEGVAFCANCGTKLDNQQPQQEAQPQYQQPEYQQPQYQQPQQQYQAPYQPDFSSQHFEDGFTVQDNSPMQFGE